MWPNLRVEAKLKNKLMFVDVQNTGLRNSTAAHGMRVCGGGGGGADRQADRHKLFWQQSDRLVYLDIFSRLKSMTIARKSLYFHCRGVHAVAVQPFHEGWKCLLSVGCSWSQACK